MFEGLAEKAESAWQDAPPSAVPQDSKSDFKVPETQEAQAQSHDGAAPDLKPIEAQNNNLDKQPQGTSQQQLEAALADLSKFEKVKLPDGTEMTRDELTRAIMRQQDYTKKTQELAREREQYEQLKTQTEQQAEQFKYESNYRADLNKVLANPSLLNEFEQELTSLKEERQRENLMFVDSRLQSLETTLLTKYPKADMTTVYANLDIEANKAGIDINKIKANPQVLDQMMDKLAKDSHDRFLKSYEDYAKEQSKKQIQANNKGSDIGRGGGTPGAPKASPKLKDVDMYAAMKASGAL